MRRGLRNFETAVLAEHFDWQWAARMSGPVACMLLGAVLAGCGESESDSNLIPVSGKVTMDGKLLTTGGSVSYRESTGLIQPTGQIESDGTYTLVHNRQVGAPPGSYRVVVFAWEPKEETARHGGLPRLIINQKYTNPSTTPLRVEVKENASPGDYDLTVTK